MQTIYNLDKWFRLNEGEKLAMRGGRARKVVLEVNSPAEAALYVAVAGVDPIFLALVKGRDKVEFYAPGQEEFHLMAEGCSVFLYTVDGIDISAVSDGSESFVRIIERKPRNRELELMQYEMRSNMQRMLDRQAGEYAKLIESRLPPRAAQPAGEGASAGAGKEPASDDAGKQPVQQPSKAGGGSGGKPAEKQEPEPGS